MVLMMAVLDSRIGGTGAERPRLQAVCSVGSSITESHASRRQMCTLNKVAAAKRSSYVR